MRRPLLFPAGRSPWCLGAVIILAGGNAVAAQAPFMCLPPPKPPVFKYVSLDRNANLVISYPANLDDPRATERGPIVTKRVIMPNHVVPAVAAKVARYGAGFQYSYAVSNLRGALQPITTWWLVVPSPLPRAVITFPAAWGGGYFDTALADPAVPAYFPPPAYVLLSIGRRPSGPIWPGQTLTGFDLFSRAAPGFTKSYFQADGPNDPTHDMPNDAAQEVEYYMAIRHYAKEFRFLGPAFLPGTPPAEIARSLLKSTQWLACHGELDQNSAFVRSAVDDLRGIARGTGPETLAAPPSTPMEIQLATALNLNDLARSRP